MAMELNYNLVEPFFSSAHVQYLKLKIRFPFSDLIGEVAFSETSTIAVDAHHLHPLDTEDVTGMHAEVEVLRMIDIEIDVMHQHLRNDH